MGLAMEERRERITEFVNREGSITFAELKAQFPDVSDMTLRTDLKTLDERRQIMRVHGGARSVSFSLGTDDLLSRRVGKHLAEKTEIAQKAAALVRPGHTIFIDSGSTTTAMAAVVADVDQMIFTNSITVASELSRLERPICFIVGGRLNRFSQSTCGGKAIDAVRSLTFDQVFLGVTGYQRGIGFTCGSDDEAVFKALLVERAHKTYVLMDSSKEGKPSTFKICGLDAVRAVVTDEGVSADFAATCRDEKVELI